MSRIHSDGTIDVKSVLCGNQILLRPDSLVDFHTGMTTEIRIRTSRPSTSKPSTRVPIPTVARGRRGATGAARAAARARGAAAAARSAGASSARATSARRISAANPRQSCSNPAPYASRARHLMQCRRYPGKVVKIHSDGTVDVKWSRRGNQGSPTPSTRSPDRLTQWLMSAQVRGRRQRHAAQGEVRESARFRVRLRPEALAEPQP